DLWIDFWGWVCQGENDGLGSHQLHGFFTDAATRHAEEKLCAFKGFIDAASNVAWIGLGSQRLLGWRKVGAVFLDNTTRIQHDDIGRACIGEHVDGCYTGRTSTRDDNLQACKLTTEQLQRVAQCGEDNHGSTVLIIVHNRDIEALNETTFDLKAAWCGDIFQVDSAEGWCQASDRLN